MFEFYNGGAFLISYVHRSIAAISTISGKSTTIVEILLWRESVSALLVTYHHSRRYLTRLFRGKPQGVCRED